MNEKGIRLDYTLPPAVEYLRSGWVASCQSAAVVSALLAGLSGTLLVFMEDEKHLPVNALGGRGHTLLLIASYSGVVLNVSATIGSLVLTDKLGELPVQASQRVNFLPKATVSQDTTTKMLKLYGIGSTWNYAVWHWLFCLTTGVLCILVELLVYIYLQNSTPLKIVITCVSGFALIPLLLLVMPHEFCKKSNCLMPSRPQSASEDTLAVPQLREISVRNVTV